MAKRKGIMLCYPFEEKRLAKWKPPYILQPKLDGERCRAIVDAEGLCTLVSSTGQVIQSVPHINEAIENSHLRSIELDGELYLHGAPFEFISSVVSRTVNIHLDYRLIEYHVFDLVSDDYQAARTSALLSALNHRGAGRNFGAIQIVPSRVVNTLDEIMSALDEFSKAGFEGFVVRDAFAPYVRKRSTQMMKFKPRKEDIYEIVGYAEEVSINGERKHSLGALRCTGSDGTVFSVGSGPMLTRENREGLWADKEHLIGRYARVKYQHLTTGKGVPRFPVIVDIIEL